MPKKQIHRSTKHVKYIEDCFNHHRMGRADILGSLLSDEQQAILGENLDLLFAEGKRAFQTYGRGVVDVDLRTLDHVPVKYSPESDYVEYPPQYRSLIRDYDPMTQIVLRVRFVVPPDIHSSRANHDASLFHMLTQPEIEDE
jgi:hypothetical protein